ncbi:MAG: AraC family transcriptional regulator [Eubacteriales bacterium]|nr:AraC family transcriptional regulator [Eubacteriales bacterium]
MSKVRLQYELDLEDSSIWITCTPGAIARGGFLYLQEIGDFQARSRYYTDREILPSYLIKIVLSGEGLLTYRGQTHALLPGKFFWIDCKEHQYYRTAPGAQNWHLLWVHFFGGNAERYYEQFQTLGQGASVGTLSADSTIEDCMRQRIAIYQRGQSTPAQDLRASALLATIMAECIQSIGAPADARCASPDIVHRLRRYLTEHHSERITLDTLGERFSIDKFYLQKLFKRHIGLTPNEFLILFRLNQAKELLRTTQRPVGEISLEVGIPNASHFIKLFRRYEGVTPGVYRQNWYAR